MNQDQDGFADWLEANEVKNLDDLPGKKPAPETRYPCGRCHGTGRYTGTRIHQPKAHCFACKGKGYFLTSPQARQRAKVQRQSQAQRKLKADIASTVEVMGDDLWEWLNSGVTNWHEFAADLLTQLNTKGWLSEKQIGALRNSMQRCEQRRLEREERKANAPVVDLTKIKGLFDDALARGLNKRALRFDSLKLTPASDRSKNPGAVYVKDDGEYAGKITPEGKYFPVNGAREGIEAELLKIAADPAKEARLYGQRTGTCCCCGRELTDPSSIDAGIGPICAEKWGL